MNRTNTRHGINVAMAYLPVLQIVPYEKPGLVESVLYWLYVIALFSVSLLVCLVVFLGILGLGYAAISEVFGTVLKTGRLLSKKETWIAFWNNLKDPSFWIEFLKVVLGCLWFLAKIFLPSFIAAICLYFGFRDLAWLILNGAETVPSFLMGAVFACFLLGVPIYYGYEIYKKFRAWIRKRTGSDGSLSKATDQIK